MNVEITIPDYCIGDVLSDTTGRRGGNVIGIKNV
jgi:translation elongation factor EF-G